MQQPATSATSKPRSAPAVPVPYPKGPHHACLTGELWFRPTKSWPGLDGSSRCQDFETRSRGNAKPETPASSRDRA